MPEADNCSIKLRDLNFGDVDAKNEILKQTRTGEKFFFDSYLVPENIEISEYDRGEKFFILGLKGTGKTALLRYIHDRALNRGDLSEMLLFKSDVTEEDRQSLSRAAGFQILNNDDIPSFIQDFKEAWKWFIYQKIAERLVDSDINDENANRLIELTGVKNQAGILGKLGQLFTRLSATGIKLSGEAYGIAVSLGIGSESDKASNTVSLSSLNRVCSGLLDQINYPKSIYLLFDELELFNQTQEQFDRDRRIIRDLIFSISFINSQSAEAGRKIFILSSLRSEVLHSILELGHEIGRDVDDFGDRLEWTGQKISRAHPLLNLVERKIRSSAQVPVSNVWEHFFPDMINNQEYYRFILNTSYFRPRDIVRLLNVAREYDKNATKFTSAHFDHTSLEFSRQTWLEVSEELLAAYSSSEVEGMLRIFLGFKTHFFFSDLIDRIENRYKNDRVIQGLIKRRDLHSLLADLYRIGVVGNDFISIDNRGRKLRRNRWVFRGNTTLNDAERMAFHKSLWKHLSLV